MSVIEVGKGAIIKNGDNFKYVRVSEDKQERLYKFRFSCKDMIGKPFGTAFRVVDAERLEIVDAVLVQDHSEEYDKAGQQRDDATEDNRTIVDGAETQRLGKEEITMLKETGRSGEEIVQELIDNNATFEGRTEFSKAKYVKKKKKKYLAQFVVLRPSTRLLSQMYFQVSPMKVLQMRPDSLAQILTWSNVHHESNVLLFETCQGLVAGAVLDRLGGSGKIVQLYQGSYPVRIIMEQFNFAAEDVKRVLSSYPACKLSGLSELFASKPDDELVEMIIGKRKEGEKRACLDEPTTFKVGVKRKLESDQRRSAKYLSRDERINETLQALTCLRSKCFDSLIIATKYHPKSLLLTLLPYLRPSCPFVVYFTHQEPLMECYVILRELKIATFVEVTESWFRNIQVLPCRTRPENVMSGSGGYILRGIKVDG